MAKLKTTQFKIKRCGKICFYMYTNNKCKSFNIIANTKKKTEKWLDETNAGRKGKTEELVNVTPSLQWNILYWIKEKLYKARQTFGNI